MFKICLVIFLPFACISSFYGQDIGGIVTDRPGQSESPIVIPKVFFQIEAGVLREVKGKNKCIQAPTILLKYGLSKRFELRFISEYLSFYEVFENGKNYSVEGFSPLSLGVKVNILKQQGLVPNLAITSHLTLPYIGNAFFRPNYILPRTRVIASHVVNDKITLLYNIGLQWVDGDFIPLKQYTFLISYSLVKRIAVFLESYGFYKKDVAFNNSIDTGFSYLVGMNHQLDFSSGIGFLGDLPSNYFSIGYSVRFKTKKM